MAMAKEKEQVTRRRCDLCELAVAAVHCDPDQAVLCWGCDARVHGANFLVARHARALLCRRCLRSTPWRADGPRLTPTISLCQRCHCRPRHLAREGEGETDQAVEGHGEVANSGADAGAAEEEGGGEQGKHTHRPNEEEKGKGENQVVPWWPPSATCNSALSGDRRSLKRIRGREDAAAQELSGMSEPAPASGERKTISTLFSGDFRPSKRTIEFFGAPIGR